MVDSSSVTLKRTIAFCALLFGFVLGCGPTIEVREYERTASQEFKDELGSFSPRDKEEAAIKSILYKIKDAYEKCDKRPLLPVFSDNYTQSVFNPPSSAMTITRAEFFTGHAMGNTSQNRCSGLTRQLSMAKIKVVRSDVRIDLVLLTMYASKYFNSKFMETILFRRHNGKMVVVGRVIVPLYPKSAKYYHAEIHIGSLSEFDKWSADLQRMALDDADIVIERLLARHNYTNKRVLPIDPPPKAVVVLFREPLPPGTRVNITHWYYSDRGNRDTFEKNFTIRKVNPWFFLTTASSLTRDGTVTYMVSVNDEQVLIRKYNVW